MKKTLSRMTLGPIEDLNPEKALTNLGKGIVVSSHTSWKFLIIKYRDNRIRERVFADDSFRSLTDRDFFLESADQLLKEHKLYVSNTNFKQRVFGGPKLTGTFYREKEEEYRDI